MTTLNPVLHNTLNAFLPEITGGPSGYDLDQFDAFRYLDFVLWYVTFYTLLALDEAIASINISLMFTFIPLLKQVGFRSFEVSDVQSIRFRIDYREM